MRFNLLSAGAWLLFATVPLAAQAPERDEQAAAAEEVATLDVERLFADRDYAEEVLGRLAALEGWQPNNAELHDGLEDIRLIALLTLERNEEALAVVDRVLERRPRTARLYGLPWYAAVHLEQPRRAADIAVTAAHAVPASEWAGLRSALSPPAVWQVIRALRDAGDRTDLTRFADALIRIGWPGPDDPRSTDAMRRILIDDLMARGETAEAADIAAAISTPNGILPLLVLHRYDPLIGERDRLELLRRAIAESDRKTSAAAAASPENYRRILDRAQHLRALGRDAEALAGLTPSIRDVAATAAAEEDGMWLVNEAAYALAAEGRTEEALALMRELAALPMAEDPYLISGAINYGELLFDAGRHREALDHAMRLEQEAGQHASDYGKMWIANTIVCALARLDRAAETAPWMERMRELRDVNPAALSRSYLCLGDDDAAAQLMVHRLGKDDPIDAVLALQDFERSRGVSQTGALQERLTALRDRPDVRAALDGVGRVISLPLSRTYWGGF